MIPEAQKFIWTRRRTPLRPGPPNLWIPKVRKWVSGGDLMSQGDSWKIAGETAPLKGLGDRPLPTSHGRQFEIATDRLLRGSQRAPSTFISLASPRWVDLALLSEGSAYISLCEERKTIAELITSVNFLWQRERRLLHQPEMLTNHCPPPPPPPPPRGSHPEEARGSRLKGPFLLSWTLRSAAL